MPTKKLVDKFRYGKYKGLTLEEVIDQDPEYISKKIEGQQILLDNEAYSFYTFKIDLLN